MFSICTVHHDNHQLRGAGEHLKSGRGTEGQILTLFHFNSFDSHRSYCTGQHSSGQKGLVISSSRDSIWSQCPLKYLWWEGHLQTGRDRLQGPLSPITTVPSQPFITPTKTFPVLTAVSPLPAILNPYNTCSSIPGRTPLTQTGRQLQITLSSGVGTKEVHVSLYRANHTESCGRASGYSAPVLQGLEETMWPL